MLMHKTENEDNNTNDKNYDSNNKNVNLGYPFWCYNTAGLSWQSPRYCQCSQVNPSKINPIY